MTVALAAVVIPVSAGQAMAWNDCEPCTTISCNPCDAIGCKPKKSLWEFGGWIDTGIYANEYGQKSSYTGGTLDRLSGNTFLLQNVKQTDWQVNQTWLYFGKKLSKRGWDVGGRVDIGYGTDMNMLQAANLEFNYNAGNDRWGTGDYYLALPQLYGEIGYNNVSVKFGKFIAPHGYESIMSPERFFYSLSYSNNSAPNTLSGAVATWDVSRNFSVYGGWVNGGDQFFENENDNAFLGGIDWKLNKRFTVGYSALVGEDTRGADDREYFIQSLYTDVKVTKRFNYVFEWTLQNESIGARNFGSYGINNFLFYKLNDRWSVGVRAEWMHQYDTAWSDDALGITLGANWKPTKWLTVKPELRYDVIDDARPFNRVKSNGFDPKDEQLSGGVSVVVHY